MRKVLSLFFIYFLFVVPLFLLGSARVSPPVEGEVGIVLPKPPEVPEQPLYLALIWDGEIARLGEANSETIMNMLSFLERYPQIHMTFNLSPEMIEYMNSGALGISRRLQDLGRIVVAMVPPGRLILPLLYHIQT
jgi:hypothetical protein